MSTEKTYLGIDIVRMNIAFCVIDENKNVIDSFSIMNDGYRKQRNQMISEHRFNGTPVYTPIGNNQVVVLRASSETENALFASFEN